MANGRRGLTYPGYGGFGYARGMGPVAGEGTRRLSEMAEGSPAAGTAAPKDDPLWSEIESTFSDILGDYAEMDLDMPIKPPNMEDASDQLRYLKDLEALGMSSGPSATLMKQQGMNLTEALNIMKFQATQQKERTALVMSLIPLLENNPELQATMSAQVLNSIMPGQFDVQDKSLLGGLGPFDKEPGVARMTPETATKGLVYEGVASNALPAVTELLGKASASRSDADAQAVNDYLNSIIKQLTEGGVNQQVADAIADKIYSEAITQIKSKEYEF